MQNRGGRYEIKEPLIMERMHHIKVRELPALHLPQKNIHHHRWTDIPFLIYIPNIISRYMLTTALRSTTKSQHIRCTDSSCVTPWNLSSSWTTRLYFNHGRGNWTICPCFFVVRTTRLTTRSFRLCSLGTSTEKRVLRENLVTRMFAIRHPPF